MVLLECLIQHPHRTKRNEGETHVRGLECIQLLWTNYSDIVDPLLPLVGWFRCSNGRVIGPISWFTFEMYVAIAATNQMSFGWHRLCPRQCRVSFARPVSYSLSHSNSVWIIAVCVCVLYCIGTELCVTRTDEAWCRINCPSKCLSADLLPPFSPTIHVRQLYNTRPIGSSQSHDSPCVIALST